MQEKTLLSAPAVAVLLGVQSDTVRKYVQRGILKPAVTKQGRTARAYLFSQSAIDAYLLTRRAQGRPRR